MDKFGEQFLFLNKIAEKYRALEYHLDVQISILVGLSSAIFVFANSRNPITLPFLVLGIFSGITAVCSLFAIHPPKFMRGKNRERSFFHNKKIASFKSSSEYKKIISNALENKDIIMDESILEIYNMVKYYYQPKRLLLKIARNILVLGIIISSILFIIRY